MAETVSGLNIKLSLDGRDLENELKDINKELKSQQKDLQAINTKLKYDSSNVSLWREKQAKLNDILLATKQKLETQNHELIKAKEAVKIGKMSKEKLRHNTQSVSGKEYVLTQKTAIVHALEPTVNMLYCKRQRFFRKQFGVCLTR